ncbi:leucine zipper putative tumor suppressor 1-like [Lingula anatina]|uniref:Leucine zipper putative tumor suppressor 1-like n=1 Tax=Lingula anatina TaxID=7574 RepID=A0A1S3IWX1_LINAN|nr:leucine zipper putative tumor suppressor 1-like [Lingula anatina]|eukprot:XP_013402466.1 leucine zipper putative tumor suppressor 1-like [Lingula anatina]
MDATGKPHWVEELFPVTFTLDSADLDLDTQPTDIDVQKADKKEPETKISQFDLSSIKNVYERVLLMTQIEEEEREKEKRAKELRKKGELKFRSRGCQTETVPVDPEDSAIWSTKEISVLRSVFRTAKEQNAKLKHVAEDLDRRNKELETRCKNQAKALDSRNKSLREVAKANERLKILCDSLKVDSQKAGCEIEELTAELRHTKSLYSETCKDLNVLRKDHDHLRLLHKNVMVDMENQKQEFLREHRLREENIKLLYENDISDLQRDLVSVTAELEKEKQEHYMTKKGLEHLRKHFSSLPTESASSAFISETDVTNLDYYP